MPTGSHAKADMPSVREDGLIGVRFFEICEVGRGKINVVSKPISYF